MLKPLAAVLCLLMASPSLAADWRYEGGSVPIAYVDTGAAQFQFACRGGDLAMGFWVRKPGKTVAEATSMSLAINTGSRDASLSGADTRFAQDFPLLHSDGTSMVVRGPVARQWAQIAQRAADAIRIAYVRNKASGGLEMFDVQAFGARGSNAAIAKVLGQCR